MKHELKIKPEYFAAVFFGEKTFEIRNNADRNFQVGDSLLLKAWDGEFTGDFVEKVVSYITNFEQKPGYVVLGLVNHHKREQALADGMASLADRCTLLAELLREANDSVYFHLESPDSRLSGEEAGKLIALTERIADALAVKRPDHPERTLDMVPEGWQLVPVEPTTQMLAAFVEAGGKAVSGYKAMLAAATEAEPTNGRIITDGQELELVTVLQSIVNGFSDDPAHDAAALLKRITGEVPWTGDSFLLPPCQGGEQIVKCPHCNAEFQDGSDAAEFIGWHGLCSSCELKGGEPCAIEPRSSSPD
ncbi:ASCH/PUA domain-containing protein [Aeromonas veronii]